MVKELLYWWEQYRVVECCSGGSKGLKKSSLVVFDGTKHEGYMRLRRKKYCGAGILSVLSHLS